MHRRIDFSTIAVDCSEQLKSWVLQEKMEIVNVSEYEALAKEKLPKMVFDYYASGAEDQWTLQENRRAFERIRYF
jgi:hypothetical protein